MQKHRGGAVATLLALSLVLAGCSDGSDGGSSDNDATTITAATAENITASELVGTKWSYDGDGYTMTIEFESDKVTTREVYDGGSNSNIYTYSVDGSTVTLYDSGEKRGELIYVSGQLVQVWMTFTREDSSGSGSAISLAGTTWTNGNDIETVTFEFQSGGTVTITNATSSARIDVDGTYSISGSMVTIDYTYEGNSVQATFIYSSDQLVLVGSVYTKDS